MMSRLLLYALSLAASASLSAAPPKWIDIPAVVVPVKPVSPVSADDPIAIADDQWFVVASETPIIVRQVSLGGKVTVTKSKKTTITLPSAWVIGRKPDTDDPEFTTITGKNLYVIKANAAGLAYVFVIPTAMPVTEADVVELRFNVGGKPVPPPGPNPPGPDPKPVVVSSFRVILAYETGTTLPAKQNGVLFGKAVQDWLTANTTPENGLAGWRRYDKDTDASKDSTTIKAMWEAVKPKITTVPCIAIEVNGKVDIVPLPSSPEEAVALFKKYKGE